MLEPGSGGDASMDHGDGTSFASFLTHERRSKMHHLNPARHDANFWILDPGSKNKTERCRYGRHQYTIRSDEVRPLVVLSLRELRLRSPLWVGSNLLHLGLYQWNTLLYQSGIMIAGDYTYLTAMTSRHG
jgi:hypothetical protein